GRYYYGALVGLTDASGAAAITDRQLEVGFVADQQLFPMDYRVPLSGCDSSIVVRVEGGAEFREVQSDVATNPLIRANARRMWQAARNEWVSSTSVEVELEPRSGARNVPAVATPAVGWGRAGRLIPACCGRSGPAADS